MFLGFQDFVAGLFGLLRLFLTALCSYFWVIKALEQLYFGLLSIYRSLSRFTTLREPSWAKQRLLQRARGPSQSPTSQLANIPSLLPRKMPTVLVILLLPDRYQSLALAERRLKLGRPRPHK
jgi:hypothetical protein